MEQRLYEAVVDSYLHDRENLAWLRTANPHALEEMTRRLLEADSRGMWRARPQDLAALQSAALMVEGDLEESMGEVKDEFQGGKVEVLTSRQVEQWEPKWRLKRNPS